MVSLTRRQPEWSGVMAPVTRPSRTKMVYILAIHFVTVLHGRDEQKHK